VTYHFSPFSTFTDGGGFDARHVGPGPCLGDRIAFLPLAAHQRQDEFLQLRLAAGIEHPALRLRETPGQGIGDTAKLLPECNLLDHRQPEAAMRFRCIETGKTEFERPCLVSFRDFGCQLAVVELGLDFVRLQVLVREFPADRLPLPGAVA
jgi:hypothetical protein